jgi:hypothetical protein
MADNERNKVSNNVQSSAPNFNGISLFEPPHNNNAELLSNSDISDFSTILSSSSSEGKQEGYFTSPVVDNSYLIYQRKLPLLLSNSGSNNNSFAGSGGRTVNEAEDSDESDEEDADIMDELSDFNDSAYSGSELFNPAYLPSSTSNLSESLFYEPLSKQYLTLSEYEEAYNMAKEAAETNLELHRITNELRDAIPTLARMIGSTAGPLLIAALFSLLGFQFHTRITDRY